VTQLHPPAQTPTVDAPTVDAQTVDAQTANAASLGAQTAPERQVAELIVGALQLEAAPGSIDPDGRMFGEGLGLDSIDALELALAITRAYGFELRSDDERNHQIFASLRSLTRHIEAHRTR